MFPVQADAVPTPPHPVHLAAAAHLRLEHQLDANNIAKLDYNTVGYTGCAAPVFGLQCSERRFLHARVSSALQISRADIDACAFGVVGIAVAVAPGTRNSVYWSRHRNPLHTLLCLAAMGTAQIPLEPNPSRLNHRNATVRLSHRQGDFILEPAYNFVCTAWFWRSWRAGRGWLGCRTWHGCCTETDLHWRLKPGLLSTVHCLPGSPAASTWSVSLQGSTSLWGGLTTPPTPRCLAGHGQRVHGGTV